MTSGWRKVVQIKEMNFWGVEKSKGTWCEIEYEGQEEEEEVFWGAKEEKRKRPSTEHRRGKMVSKATSKFGGGSFLRSRKGNGFLREPEGQGYKQARRRRRDEGSGKGSRRRLLWSHLQREEQGGDLMTKIGNRGFWADHALEQKRVNFVVALLVQLTVACKS